MIKDIIMGFAVIIIIGVFIGQIYMDYKLNKLEKQEETKR